MGSDALALPVRSKEGARRGLLGVALISLCGLAALLTQGAPSAAAADACPNAGHRVAQDATFLPECRAYEMVSPVDKNGGRIFPPAQTAADGNRVVFSSTASFAGAPSAARVNAYRATRSADGWVTESLNPLFSSAPVPNIPALRGLTADLSTAVVNTNAPLVPGSPHGEGLYNIFRRDNAGAYDLITPVAPEGFGQLFYYPTFVAGSADYSHLLYSASFPQLPGAPEASPSLYEWVDGELRIASILPNEEIAPNGAGAGEALSSADSSGLQSPQFAELRNVISDDGSRIFFTAGGYGLHVRENGLKSTKIGPLDAQFSRATPDGSYVLYASAGDLYRYDVEAEASTLLSVDGELGDGSDHQIASPGGNAGVVAFSDDGSVAYFTAMDQLVAGEPTAPGPKLYVWDGGELRYIAPLIGGASDNADNLNWQVASFPGPSLSADGRRLAFFSQLPLTGYDSTSPVDCERLDNSVRGNQCRQIFLYDADSDDLRCVSCNPSGAPPHGDVLDAPYSLLGASFTTKVNKLSADGSRVYFESIDPLVGRDSNGKYDVYEWHEGKLSLISTGRATSHATLVAATPDGSDVFFTTAQPLVGQDNDESFDLYDARVGGGLDQGGPPRGTACEGDACQGAPEGAPAARDPGSAGLAATRQRAERCPRLTFAKVGPRERSRLAAGGRVILRVSVAGPAKLSAVGSARLGGKAARRVLGATRRAEEAEVVRVPVALSPAARRALAGRGLLTVKLAVSAGRGCPPRRATLKLAASQPQERANTGRRAGK